MKKIYRYIIMALALISLVYVVSDITLSKYQFTVIPPQYKLDIERVILKQNEVLEQTFERTRISKEDYAAILAEISKYIDIGAIDSGDFYDVLYDHTTKLWTSIWFYPKENFTFYSIEKENNEIKSKVKELQSSTRTIKIASRVSENFYETALKLNLSEDAIKAFSNVFACDIDLLQESDAGDYFKIIYEMDFIDKKGTSKFVKIIAAEYKTSSKTYSAFYFEPSATDSKINYFNLEAKSLKTAYLFSPFAAEPSIYKTASDPSKKLIDRTLEQYKIIYALKSKLPVLATADGTIVAIPQNSQPVKRGKGGQSKNVAQQKTTSPTLLLQTLDGNTISYVYLNSIEKGIAKNTRVRQGAILGYADSKLELQIMKGKTELNYFNMKRYPEMSLRGEERQKFLEWAGRMSEVLRDM